jgi:hypothetical protein
LVRDPGRSAGHWRHRREAAEREAKATPMSVERAVVIVILVVLAVVLIDKL